MCSTPWNQLREGALRSFSFTSSQLWQWRYILSFVMKARTFRRSLFHDRRPTESEILDWIRDIRGAFSTCVRSARSVYPWWRLRAPGLPAPSPTLSQIQTWSWTATYKLNNFLITLNSFYRIKSLQNKIDLHVYFNKMHQSPTVIT